MSIVEGFWIELQSSQPSWPPQDRLIPLYHHWIRDRVPGHLFLDVADYAHVPGGPGIVLVTHEGWYGLKRSAEGTSLVAQRRFWGSGDARESLADLLRRSFDVADRLERDLGVPGDGGFIRNRILVGSNDRLRAPNTDDGYAIFEPLVRSAIALVDGTLRPAIARLPNDPRERLACEVRLG